jgi:hypothetical protein
MDLLVWRKCPQRSSGVISSAVTRFPRAIYGNIGEQSQDRVKLIKNYFIVFIPRSFPKERSRSSSGMESHQLIVELSGGHVLVVQKSLEQQPQRIVINLVSKEQTLLPTPHPMTSCLIFIAPSPQNLELQMKGIFFHSRMSCSLTL